MTASLARLGEVARRLGGTRPGRPPGARRDPGFGAAIPAPAAPAGHPSVVAADPYSFAVAHRRLAWLLRLSTMTNAGLL
ncbi:hypothetical protein GGD89_003286, partial [Roseospira visakhapatnamensis]|nr:hypothetical protein [Roseospira visakhapatnamensis]